MEADRKIMRIGEFSELSQEEQLEIDGGVWPAIGVIIAAGTAIYGYGYARGKNAAHKKKGHKGR